METSRTESGVHARKSHKNQEDSTDGNREMPSSFTQKSNASSITLWPTQEEFQMRVTEAQTQHPPDTASRTKPKLRAAGSNQTGPKTSHNPIPHPNTSETQSPEVKKLGKRQKLKTLFHDVLDVADQFNTFVDNKLFAQSHSGKINITRSASASGGYKQNLSLGATRRTKSARRPEVSHGMATAQNEQSRKVQHEDPCMNDSGFLRDLNDPKSLEESSTSQQHPQQDKHDEPSVPVQANSVPVESTVEYEARFRRLPTPWTVEDLKQAVRDGRHPEILEKIILRNCQRAEWSRDPDSSFVRSPELLNCLHEERRKGNFDHIQKQTLEQLGRVNPVP